MSDRLVIPTESQAALVDARIRTVAKEVSDQQLVLVSHRPEAWAVPRLCFVNVAEKINRDGGHGRIGWTFHLRFVEHLPGDGYLALMHHAVWHRPDGYFVNVTPYLNQRDRPIFVTNGEFLFLIDDAASPMQSENHLAPLPTRFFPLGDGEELARYVKTLNENDQESYDRECRSALELSQEIVGEREN
jgi:hypothetical protein